AHESSLPSRGRGKGEGSFGHLGGARFKPLTSILSPSPRGEATETDRATVVSDDDTAISHFRVDMEHNSQRLKRRCACRVCVGLRPQSSDSLPARWTRPVCSDI